MVCFGLFWLIVAFYAIVLFVVARYGWVGMHGFGKAWRKDTVLWYGAIMYQFLTM